MVRAFQLLFILFTIATMSGAEMKPIYKLNEAELRERLRADTVTVEIHRNGLRDVFRFVASRPGLFPAGQPQENRLLRREEKEVVWNVWQRFLDYMVALDSAEQYHANCFRLKGAAREDSFFISYAAMLAKYRAALEFIDRTEHHPELDKVLNDAVPELGLPAGTYARLKFKYLNVVIATQFAASAVVMKTFREGHPQKLRDGIRADAEYLWKAGRGRGETLTAKNALKVVQNGVGSAWLPVQAGVSDWMGDTKVYRVGRSLVSEKQVRELQTKLLPGDVMLIRHEWFLSNIGLPGFWPHAALYIGTPAERRAFFADADAQAWVKQQGETSGDLEVLLQSRSLKSQGLPKKHFAPRERANRARD